MKLAEQQETEGLVHFSAGKNQIADRGMPRAVRVRRPQFRRGIDLNPEVGRGI
jgi:hypothetical protein